MRRFNQPVTEGLHAMVGDEHQVQILAQLIRQLGLVQMPTAAPEPIIEPAPRPTAMTSESIRRPLISFD